MHNLFNRKYCNNCSTYTSSLRLKLGRYKYELKKLRKKFYGTSLGTQRIRKIKKEEGGLVE